MICQGTGERTLLRWISLFVIFVGICVLLVESGNVVCITVQSLVSVLMEVVTVVVCLFVDFTVASI